MLGRRSHCQIADEPHHPIDECLALGDRCRECGAAQRMGPFGPANLHSKRCEHLAELVVQLAGQILALFLLSSHELVREPAQLLLGLMRPLVLCLERRSSNADADNRSDCDNESEREARGRASTSRY